MYRGCGWSASLHDNAVKIVVDPRDREKLAVTQEGVPKQHYSGCFGRMIPHRYTLCLKGHIRIWKMDLNLIKRNRPHPFGMGPVR